MDGVFVGAQMSKYSHNVNELNFTHRIVIEVDNYYSAISTSHAILLRQDLIAAGHTYCRSQGWRSIPKSGLVFPAGYDYDVDYSGYHVYFKFQSKDMAMLFKLGFDK